MSEIRKWPRCAVCSEKHAVNGEPVWWPVEAYEVQDEPPRRIVCNSTMRVIARCSHKESLDKKDQNYQDAIIDVPMWWGEAHKLDAIASLTFFAPGRGRPDHGLVTDI